MQINFIQGTNYSSAPSWLTGAGGVLDQIQSFYGRLFTNNITIDVTLNWVPLAWSQTSTNEGGTLASNNITSGTNGVTSSFSTLSAALVSHAQYATQNEAYANMPTSGVSSVYIAPAEAMILGLEPKATVNIYVDVNSSANWLGDDGFAPLDAFGAICHEISERGMGRFSQVGGLDVMDMWRFSGSGQHDLTTGATSSSTINSSAYFSIDNGATNLGWWPNDPGQGDYGDWIQGRAPVPNDAYGTVGTGESYISEVDIELMNVLGWSTDVVTSGDTLSVHNGATLSGYDVMAGGIVDVLSGGTTSNFTYTDAVEFGDDGVLGASSSGGVGAFVFVESGGSELGATLDGEGFEWVDAGGDAISTTVKAYGTILAFGTVDSAKVSAHGLLNVESGGSGNYNSVISGGTLSVFSGGSSLGNHIESGGTEVVLGLSVLDGVSSGGNQIVSSGGSAGLDGIDAGATQTVEHGGTDIASLIGGSEYVYGVGSNETVSGEPANQYVESGGRVVGATLTDIGFQIVESGGVASSTSVGADTYQIVSSGGNVVSSIVGSGGVVELLAGAIGDTLTVSAGATLEGPGALIDHNSVAGTVSGVTVGDATHDDSLELLSGGVAFDVTATLGHDYLQVDIGASATGTVLTTEGYDLVYGLAVSTTVSSGGTEYVDSGGETLSATVLDGGTEDLASGTTGDALTVSGGGVVSGPGVLIGADTIDGAANSVGVGAGGTATFGAGGLAYETTVLSGGRETLSGGRAIGTTASGGALFYVLAGATATGTVLAAGGEMVVSSGGVASATTILSGSLEYVRASGATTGTVVSSGGQETVSSGGVAALTSVLSGGRSYVSSGGVASGTTVSNDGRETILAGGEARGLAVAAGGVLVDDGEVRIAGAGTLAGVLSGSGLIVQTAAGDLLLSGSDAAFSGGALIEGGTIELATAGALGSGYAQFEAPATGSAVLQIDAADAPAAGGTFANTIYDFSGADEDIDLRSIAYVSGASATVSGGVLVLSDGGKTYKFNLAGTTAGAYPVLSDGHGGTLIDPTAAGRKATAPKPIDPKALAFAHTLAAFAPSDAANTALVSSTSPTGRTPFLHAPAAVDAGRL